MRFKNDKEITDEVVGEIQHTKTEDVENSSIRCNVLNPIFGEIVPIENIEDEVFKSGTIGQVVVILP